MYSGLVSATGKEFEQFKYYDIGDQAEQLVKIYIERDPNLKEEFIEFKKDYTHFKPYLDFLICRLGYQFKNPFLTEGTLYGKNGEIYYKSTDLEYKYLKASDSDLNISHVNIDNIVDSIIDPEGLCYTIDRKEGQYHEQYFDTILMHRMISNKELYCDYIKCKNEYENIYYITNAYFRNRLGYLQVVKYPNGSGHILYNSDLATSYIKGLLNSVKEFYPNIQLNDDEIPEELIDDARNMRDEVIDIEMSELYEGRRL